MDAATLKTITQEKLKLNKIDFQSIDDLFDAQLPVTLQNLWNQYAWDEKRLTEDLTVSSSTYELTPSSNFEQIESLVYKGTTIKPPIKIVSEGEFDSYYPNPNAESSGAPWMAKVVTVANALKIVLGPKSDGSYTIQAKGRRKVPGIDEVPTNLVPLLVDMFFRDIILPSQENYFAANAAVNQKADGATNVNPKGVPDISTMQSGVKHGKHVFSMTEGFQNE